MMRLRNTAHNLGKREKKMIPAIGLMIGAYVITRMLDILAGEKKNWIKGAAVVTILVALISVIDILNAGSRVSALN